MIFFSTLSVQNLFMKWRLFGLCLLWWSSNNKPASCEEYCTGFLPNVSKFIRVEHLVSILAGNIFYMGMREESFTALFIWQNESSFITVDRGKTSRPVQTDKTNLTFLDWGWRTWSHEINDIVVSHLLKGAFRRDETSKVWSFCVWGCMKFRYMDNPYLCW